MSGCDLSQVARINAVVSNVSQSQCVAKRFAQARAFSQKEILAQECGISRLNEIRT